MALEPVPRRSLRPPSLKPGEVRMYVCGMTVYDYCHLGHARMLVVFDVVARYLRALGYRLTYVRNITDIDDKIIKRANENAESIQALTERFIAAGSLCAGRRDRGRKECSGKKPGQSQSMSHVGSLVQG